MTKKRVSKKYAAKKVATKKRGRPKLPPKKVSVYQATAAVMTLAKFVAPGPMAALDAVEKGLIRAGLSALLKKVRG